MLVMVLMDHVLVKANLALHLGTFHHFLHHLL